MGKDNMGVIGLGMYVWDTKSATREQISHMSRWIQAGTSLSTTLLQLYGQQGSRVAPTAKSKRFESEQFGLYMCPVYSDNKAVTGKGPGSRPGSALGLFSFGSTPGLLATGIPVPEAHV